MYALSMSEARALTDDKNNENKNKNGFSETLISGLAEVGLALRPGAIPLGVCDTPALPPETSCEAPDIIAQLNHKQKKKLLK